MPTPDKIASISPTIPPTIASFRIDHRFIVPGIYVSRVDADSASVASTIITYDLRHRAPNNGDYLSPLTSHSLEHMFATYIRSSEIGAEVLYYGPMGCLTGFYLLVRAHSDESLKHTNRKILLAVRDTLRLVAASERMFGNSETECGNYRLLSLEAAKTEAERFLAVVETISDLSFEYPRR